MKADVASEGPLGQHAPDSALNDALGDTLRIDGSKRDQSTLCTFSEDPSHTCPLRDGISAPHLLQILEGLHLGGSRATVIVLVEVHLVVELCACDLNLLGVNDDHEGSHVH